MSGNPFRDRALKAHAAVEDLVGFPSFTSSRVGASLGALVVTLMALLGVGLAIERPQLVRGEGWVVAGEDGRSMQLVGWFPIALGEELEKGQEVEATIDDFPGGVTGTLAEIGGRASPESSRERLGLDADSTPDEPGLIAFVAMDGDPEELAMLEGSTIDQVDVFVGEERLLESMLP